MRHIMGVASAVAVLALVCSACGGSSDGAGAEPEQDPQTTTERLETGPSEDEQLEMDEAATCVEEMTPIVDALLEVDGRLDVGLSYDELSDYVGDVGVAYARINIGALSPTCLGGVAVQAENAYNSYTRSLRAWGDCIEDYACDTDGIDPKLQRIWAQASNQIERAQTGLQLQQDTSVGLG